ncbi:hypothetical protein OG563_37625 [Nocardia vinacea]|uniref:Uncharacterized protein n=1 Tax=Nocardia vinacea TaxID=96468 RepID=A0ABZ1YSC0_9NOCA|nr:hypothetical protein [Nocardia vinacea]
MPKAVRRAVDEFAATIDDVRPAVGLRKEFLDESGVDRYASAASGHPSGSTLIYFPGRAPRGVLLRLSAVL